MHGIGGRDARFPATSIRASPSDSSGAGAQIGLTEPTEHRRTVADRPEVRLHDKYRQALAGVSCDYNRSLMSRHCRRWQQIQIPRLDKPCRQRLRLLQRGAALEGTRMPYVDGFIVAVPKKNLEAYTRMAKKAGKIWREYGALDYREWVAEDVSVGKRTSFPRAVKLRPGETVIFSWITYKSRAQRDRINAKVMADPRLKSMMDPKALPFDARRMIYGGFESLVKI